MCKKALKPIERKALSLYLMDNYDITVRRSCTLLSLGPNMYYYEPRGLPD